MISIRICQIYFSTILIGKMDGLKDMKNSVNNKHAISDRQYITRLFIGIAILHLFTFLCQIALMNNVTIISQESTVKASLELSQQSRETHLSYQDGNKEKQLTVNMDGSAQNTSDIGDNLHTNHINTTKLLEKYQKLASELEEV